MRFPVAANMALQIAGIVGGTPGSPTHRRQVKLSEPIPEALVLSPLPLGEG